MHFFKRKKGNRAKKATTINIASFFEIICVFTVLRVCPSDSRARPFNLSFPVFVFCRAALRRIRAFGRFRAFGRIRYLRRIFGNGVCGGSFLLGQGLRFAVGHGNRLSRKSFFGKPLFIVYYKQRRGKRHGDDVGYGLRHKYRGGFIRSVDQRHYIY